MNGDPIMNIVLGITGSVAAIVTEKLCASLLSSGHAGKNSGNQSFPVFPATGDGRSSQTRL